MPSRYKPQLVCWNEDLSKTSGRGILGSTNYIACATDNYLEIFRKRKIIGPYFGFFLFGSIEVAIIFAFFFSLNQNRIDFFVIITLFLTSIGLGLFLYFILFNLLFGQFAPVSNPIRFNRKTGKVYLYEAVATKWMFRFWKPLCSFNDLNKFEIKVYDWENFHGVLQRSTGAFASGGTIEHNSLYGVACKPGSYEVIEYIYIRETDCFAGDWDWISHFMEFRTNEPLDQIGLQYLNYYPRDAETFMQVKPRLKITSRQIEGLDKASKAGSKEELAQIEQEYELTKTVYPVE
ncbi:MULTISPECIES: DUF6708 domain-containing protein [unclassified Gilliamella]|uniref:DUF6708 domain-containing protein n=4 Tax=unclassified Gilliamella TaxID=2685620 RepID=UPI00080DF9F2|nr:MULTISPECIES: DUF6708 domain-containing protein [Gilliamella]MCX8574798.1 hypothetical protein [Gilliamella sp. B3831]MCX8577214.1 hypothetical protein [Gilliamella sp. B3815]MCX8604260.1 hypothetical protein [Gilliamella sp. B3823]MCX8637832.1 hypothetical protein [Gilliamella sp. B3817]OCG01824.1 hypothetical protein A9G10_03665 [Gilliamella apicola]